MKALDAYHEAAHAILAICLHHRFEYVMLCNIREGRRIVTGRVVFPKELDGLGQFLYREDAYGMALVLLAGAVANKILQPHKTYPAIYRDAACEDYVTVRNMAGFHLFNEPLYQQLSSAQQGHCEFYVAEVVLPQPESW